MVRPSGLDDVELLLFLIASLSWVVVKVSVLWSSGCCLRICLNMCLVCGLGKMWNWCGELGAEVNDY